jgi:3-hydroxyacyl-[acyl-carrier-protein] dehydratase
MPGVLMTEALAQVGAVALLSMPEYQGKYAYFAGIDNMRFRRTVHPGDILRLEVRLEKMRRSVGKASATATVQDQVACEGGIMFALADRT